MKSLIIDFVSMSAEQFLFTFYRCFLPIIDSSVYETRLKEDIETIKRELNVKVDCTENEVRTSEDNIKLMREAINSLDASAYQVEHLRRVLAEAMKTTCTFSREEKVKLPDSFPEWFSIVHSYSLSNNVDDNAGNTIEYSKINSLYDFCYPISGTPTYEQCVNAYKFHRVGLKPPSVAPIFSRMEFTYVMTITKRELYKMFTEWYVNTTITEVDEDDNANNFITLLEEVYVEYRLTRIVDELTRYERDLTTCMGFDDDEVVIRIRKDEYSDKMIYLRKDE